MGRAEATAASSRGAARPLRLLIVAHSMEHGGAEHSLLGLLERLDRTAFDCLLAAPDGPMLERYLGCCRPAVVLAQGYVPLTFHILAYARAFYATVVNTVTLCRYIRRHPVDLVLTNTGVVLHGPLAARFTGVAGVTMMREIVSPRIVRTALSRLLLGLNRLIIANSRAIVSAVGGQRSGKLLVVHGGVEVDGDRPVPASAGPLTALAARGPLIGIIGTVHPIKGHDAFLRMAAVAARRLPTAMFVIIGGYDERSRYYHRLIRLRRELGLDDRVVFTGLLDQIPAAIDQLAVLVIASSTESFPRVALEAMAAGRPVAAFDVGGLSDLIQDGLTGRLIRYGDVDAMAEAVCRLIEEPREAARLGAEGRARVRRSFQLGQYVSRVEAVLRGVRTAEG